MKEIDDREKKITYVADRAHQEWRRGYRSEHGDKPCTKTTFDQDYIREHHGINKVNIAATPYLGLPSDWREENRLNATVAVNAVLEAVQDNRLLDDADFIEKAAAIVHDEWVKRNGWATKEQKRPYAEISETEKKKDRVVVHYAIDAISLIA